MFMFDIEEFKYAVEGYANKLKLTVSFSEDEYARMYEAFVADMKSGMPFVQALTCALYYNTEETNQWIS